MSDQSRIDRVGPCVIDASVSIDGSNVGRTDEIRAGTLMAKITATGLMCPLKRTTVAESGTVTAAVVVNAAFFKAGDVVSIGADTGLTISAVNYSTNTITIPSTAIAAGDAVVCTSSPGSETARFVLRETVRLQTGVQFDSSQVNKRCSVLIGGYINAAMILGDLAAARADTAAKLGSFTWSDHH